jgi:hypothetical protein
VGKRKPNFPFDHIGTMNLFREPGGVHEITVSSTDPTVFDETPDGLRPIDHIENLILAAAARMKARKLANGTYREMPA